MVFRFLHYFFVCNVLIFLELVDLVHGLKLCNGTNPFDVGKNVGHLLLCSNGITVKALYFICVMYLMGLRFGSYRIKIKIMFMCIQSILHNTIATNY